MTYDPTPATRPSRHGERARYDEETVHAVLDEALVGHLGFVDGGLPQVLPVLFVREGRRLYLHSSTGAHPARIAARAGSLPVSFEVTLLDGLVFARAAKSHSVNYRCVVAHGEASLVRDAEEKRRILGRFVDKVAPGRSGDAREASDQELRETAVLELPLLAVSAKVRRGGPLDNDSDLTSPTWAGVVPITSLRLEPIPSPDLGEGIAVPSYLVEALGAESTTA